MPTTPQEFMKRNVNNPCKVPGCNRLRHRIGGYCNKHQRILSNWGTPTHQPISRVKDFVKEREECRKIIEHNLTEVGHKGLGYAVGYLDDWLKDAFNDTRHRTQAGHFARLYRDGITGLDILIECCATWLFWIRNPSRIHSLKHWKYFTGNCVLHMSSLADGRGRNGGRTPRTPGPVRREVGEQIHKAIGTMIVLVARAIVDHERREEAILKAMHQPLEAVSTDV